MGNEAEQQENDCYPGDEDASRDNWSVETESHAERLNPYLQRSTRFCAVAVFVGLDKSCSKKRCEQHHSQSS